MITSKPKHAVKRMLPEDLPQPAELPESGDAAAEGFESARALRASAPAARPRWVRQVMDYVEREVPPEFQVQNIVQLHKLLRRALLIEHSTIPPYLTALYSIREGTNAESVQLIRGVLVEEMLHMILAANVLNAVGGEPAVNDPRFIPTYPLDLTQVLQPNDTSDDSAILAYLVGRSSAEGFESAGGSKDLKVNLLKFSKRALDTFIAIETPEQKGPSTPGPVTTIGQFYTIIIHGLERLEEEARGRGETIFTGDPARQVGPEHYYGSGGGAYVVGDLGRARAALGEIICQGEGFKEVCYDESADLGEYEELGHYFRFMEIRKGRYYAPGDKPGDEPSGRPLAVDWTAVYDMKPNPKLRDFKGDPGLEALGRSFNETYLLLLDQIQRAFTGEPAALQDAVVTMFDLKYAAGALLRVPLGDGPQTAGPIFGPGPRRKRK